MMASPTPPRVADPSDDAKPGKYGIGMQQIMRGLYKARWPMLTVFLSCVLTAAIAVQFLPKSYSAASRVALDVGQADTITGIGLGRKQVDPYIITQMLIVSDLAVGKAVAQKLGWLDSPDMYARWLATTGGAGQFDLWAARLISNGISVNMVPESNIMEIGYRSGSIDLAKEVSVLARQAYIDTSVKARSDSARRTADMLAQQVEAAKRRLFAAEAARSAFQQANGMIVQKSGATAEDASLATLEYRAETSDAAAALRGGGERPSVLLKRLEGPLMNVDAAMALAETQLGKAHPRYQALARRQREFTALRDKALADLRAQESSRLAAAQAVGVVRDKAIDAQQQLVSGAQPTVNEFKRLQRQVDLARTQYERLAAKEAFHRMLADRTESDMVVIGDAIAVPSAIFPNVGVTLGLSILFGATLALVTALFGEIVLLRVRSRRVLELATNTDVLAVIGGQPEPRRVSWWRRVFGRSGNSQPPPQWQLAQ